MKAFREHKDLELQLVVGGTALLPRFGAAVDYIKEDGFKPDIETYMIIEGENPVTMTKSTGLALIELTTCFESLKPDIVLMIGDRFESMAIAVAAVYMNIPLAQTMCGEVSGTLDESVRHAITKLAHIHFPANKGSAERIIKMGENPSTVHTVGCPRVDLVAEIVRNSPDLDVDIFEEFKGVGDSLDLKNSFLLVSQHPVTTEYRDARRQIEETLYALKELEMPTIMLWPNVDAGSDLMAKGIRTFRERHDVNHFLHLFINLPPEIYYKCMNNCACVVGNSSSPIREGALIGVPIVNIGTRQTGRERISSVIDVGYDRREIIKAVEKQIKHGKYPPNSIYGDGKAGKKIAEILSTCELKVQKRITY